MRSICSFHREHKRWPAGAERGRAFAGTKARTYPPARRRRAYETLRENGTFALVRFKGSNREVSCYVMPMISPEYAGKDGHWFYAPPEAS